MVISSQDPTKDAVKDLEALRHTLLNGTTAIAQSLKTIEYRLAYMSKSLQLFENIIKDKESKTFGDRVAPEQAHSERPSPK